MPNLLDPGAPAARRMLSQCQPEGAKMTMRGAAIARFTSKEALVCAMVLMSVADGPMSDAEVAMMNRMVRDLPAFADFHAGEIETVTDAVAKLLGRTDGLDQAMTMLRDALPMRLRETAYLLACESARRTAMRRRRSCSSSRISVSASTSTASSPAPSSARRRRGSRCCERSAQSTMNSFAPVFVEDRCAASPKSLTW